MSKKLLSVLFALVALISFNAPAHATLTNSSTYTVYGNTNLYTALITATSNDTTANADSNTIFNYDNRITHIGIGIKATNQTGTSPTTQLQLIGSFDNSKWFVVQSKQGSTAGTTANIASTALDISTASTTNVETGISTEQFNRQGGFPPYLRVRVVVGGSSTPGWTGVVYTAVTRN